VPSERELEKLASAPVLNGEFGAVIRRAAVDRAAIVEIVGKMSKPNRALLPDVKPTSDALFDRVVSLAKAIHQMEQDVDTTLLAELNARVAALRDEGDTTDDQRRVALLRKQRDTLQQLADRRTTMVRQTESAALALGNLRLDLIKLQSSGFESALSDVTSATQQARALTKDIGAALAAVDEVRDL
jgi:serine/threonine-protein kinase